jgi:predicted TIM-barrel fold metal-dependent hydrolase
MKSQQRVPILSRREFVAAAGAGTMLGAATKVNSQAPADDAQREPLIDVNVTLSRWPLRRLPCDETSTLVAKLRSRGVTAAWAGTFDGLLHKDLRSANARLAADCRQNGDGILVPFGSVNPKLPDWEEDLRQCAKEHDMPGIRLHPNYHGYKLDDPILSRLVTLAVEQGLIIQIVLHMEDARMMHPLMRVEPVDAAPLAELVPRVPQARIVLLNALNRLNADQLTRLASSGQVYFDIAMLEGVGGLERILASVPQSRILFGSHAPLFYFEAAELKLRESVLGGAQLADIRHNNAERLLPSKGANT